MRARGDSSMLVDEETLALKAELAHTSHALTASVVRRINEDAKFVLSQRDGFLAHMTEFKIVRSFQTNYLNMRLRREYLHVIFCKKVLGTRLNFMFIPSDKFESAVIVIALHSVTGRLPTLKSWEIPQFLQVLNEFLALYSIRDESYLYTPLCDRLHAPDNVPYSQKCHSTHFHVKIQVNSSVYENMMPLMHATLKEGGREFLSRLDCISYQHSRQGMSQKEMLSKLSKDCME